MFCDYKNYKGTQKGRNVEGDVLAVVEDCGYLYAIIRPKENIDRTLKIYQCVQQGPDLTITFVEPEDEVAAQRIKKTYKRKLLARIV